MNTIDSIQLFLQQPQFAVAGVSRNKSKFGNSVYRELKQKGIKVLPVNPYMADFDGDTCYNSIENLPGAVKAIIVCTPPERTLEIVESSLKFGIVHFWFQQGSSNKEVLKLLEGKNINLVNDRCILMHAGPVKSFHAFHRFLSKITGNYPK